MVCFDDVPIVRLSTARSISRQERWRSVSDVAECPGAEDAHRRRRVREAAGSLLQWAAWARRS